jgi:RHS repeat-associated protein
MTPGVVAETDLAGTLKSEYVFFDGERVARRDGATGTAGVFYYFSDHLKTASVITDSAGVIKAESDYYPWGGELQFVNNDSNDYKFTGKKRDTETGLDYFGARYYSNGLGRWISADWSATAVPVPYADILDPQSLNLYTYVRNMPTTRADADGHIWEWLQKAINFGKYGHLVTDANLENALNADAEKYQKEMLKYGVSHNGVKLTEEDFAVMSNKEIADMGRAFNDALRHGDVGQSNDGGETQSQQLPLFPDPGQIGGGHGWNKHQGEFPGWSQNDYKATIDNTIQNPDKVKQLSYGRTAYWNDKEKMVVIHDPAHPDGGTAFRPNQSRFPGDSYLNTLR